MISNHKNYFTPLLAIIAKPFLSWNPSILTCISLVGAILFFIGIVTHTYWLSIFSTMGFLFDAIDGYVARKAGKVSAFGGFLDSVIDKVVDFSLVVAFGFAHLVAWEIVVCVVFTSLLISFMRSRGDLALHIGHAEMKGLMQRSERTLLIFILLILYLLLGNSAILSYGFVLLLVLNCITIVQRFVVVLRYAK